MQSVQLLPSMLHWLREADEKERMQLGIVRAWPQHVQQHAHRHWKSACQQSDDVPMLAHAVHKRKPAMQAQKMMPLLLPPRVCRPLMLLLLLLLHPPARCKGKK